MALTVEQRRNLMRFGIPIVGIAIPALMMLKKRGKAPYEAEKSKDQILLEESRIDLQGAMRRAVKYMPGTPIEVELEEHNGSPVWEVEIVPPKGGPTREVMIDAKTGEVLEVKSESRSESE
jgi:uncharacterized membrane protein YkoI